MLRYRHFAGVTALCRQPASGKIAALIATLGALKGRATKDRFLRSEPPWRQTVRYTVNGNPDVGSHETDELDRSFRDHELRKLWGFGRLEPNVHGSSIATLPNIACRGGQRLEETEILLNRTIDGGRDSRYFYD